MGTSEKNLKKDQNLIAHVCQIFEYDYVKAFKQVFIMM